MLDKAPKRTPDRILEAALRRFNGLGEPNVSLTAIADELGISTGNLTYHFRSKADIVLALFDRFEQRWAPCEPDGSRRQAGHPVALQGFLARSTEAVWHHRFLFRDLNELMSRDRRLETRVLRWLDRLGEAGRAHFVAMAERGWISADGPAIDALVDNLLIVSCHWVCVETSRHARRLGEPGHAARAQARARAQLWALVAALLTPEGRRVTASARDGEAANAPDFDRTRTG